jgi:RimJ/RimL family protein N-acetyltransferase
MHIRRLTPADSLVFQALRLASLRDEPTAFGSSYEEEQAYPLSRFEAWLALKPDCGPFGAFEDETLAGFVFLGREDKAKLAHKAVILGMYVAPQFRRRGLGRALLSAALSLAASIPKTRQVNLCVNADNTAAVRLYESAGFKAFGREPGALRINDVLHDELHMCLRLIGD